MSTHDGKNEERRPGSQLKDGTEHERDHRRWSRRDFLVQMGLAASATPFLLNDQRVHAMHQAPVLRALGRATTDRVLVIVQLGGGNDGLNTVIPVRNDIYYRQRPNLAIPRGDALALDDETGMHPALRPLERIWGEGRMAIVRSVGYEESTRSHFTETSRWTTGGDEEGSETGWLGRYLDANYGANPDHPPAVRFGGSGEIFRADQGVMSMTFNQDAFERLARNGGFYDVDNVPSNSMGEALSYVRSVANAAVRYAGPVQEALEAGSNRASYPDYKHYSRRALSKGLSSTARLIRGGLQTRIYLVPVGGSFDTHANQHVTHRHRMEEIADGISAFYKDLGADGLDERVLTMTFSEFGRTIKENGSRGTDHGAGAPLMLFGPALQGGLYGDAPDLTDPYHWGLRPTTDYRSVYRTVLEQWFGVEAETTEALLGDDYPALGELIETPAASESTFGGVPPSIEIEGNYPNPFRSSTTVRYGVSAASHVTLDVYNALGQHVAQPVDEPHVAGTHEVELADVQWPSGTYLCRLQAGGAVQDHTMTLVR